MLNADMPEIANEIKACHVDVAMSTNGVLFTEDKIRDCLASFTWIRFSIASMEESSYKKIQCGKDNDLAIVKKNLEEAVRIKRDRRLATTLGAQCLLLPDNMQRLPDMAKQLREIGIDYLTVKPYSQHLHSENKFEINYQQMMDLEQELKQFQTEQFAIYFRANAMKKVHHKKTYAQCYGLPFMAHIDAKGNVWPCVAHIGVKELCYGNIYEQTFQEIWEGQKRRKITERLKQSDINQVCREACRLDEINKYLHALKHPGEHVNFI